MPLIQKSGNPDTFAGEEDNPKSSTFDLNNVTVFVGNPWLYCVLCGLYFCHRVVIMASKNTKMRKQGAAGKT